MEYKIQAVKLAKELGGAKAAGKGNPPPERGKRISRRGKRFFRRQPSEVCKRQRILTISKAELTILFDEDSGIRLNKGDIFKYDADEPNAEAVGWETALFGAVSFAAYLKYLLHPQDMV